MEKIYYDNDADLSNLTDKTVGIIGYGIQGRAQALNIRDSGVKVLVGNRQDSYAQNVLQDGFLLHEIKDVASESDVILFLIPDQAQAEVYNHLIKGNIRPGAMLVFAHGYALRYKTFEISDQVDIGLLAPRMPGKQIRDYYLKDGGVPAFIDVVQDSTGKALPILLAVSKAAGFTRAGVLQVSYKVETELDLFIEQFLVASIIKAIHTSFKVLVEELKFPAMATLMELYASGEIAEVLKMAAKFGIGKVFQENASPTCQYGIAANFDLSMEVKPDKQIMRIMKGIQDGTFANALNTEGSNGYPTVRKLWDNVNNKLLLETQEAINRSFRIGTET